MLPLHSRDVACARCALAMIAQALARPQLHFLANRCFVLAMSQLLSVVLLWAAWETWGMGMARPLHGHSESAVVQVACFFVSTDVGPSAGCFCAESLLLVFLVESQWQ